MEGRVRESSCNCQGFCVNDNDIDPQWPLLCRTDPKVLCTGCVKVCVGMALAPQNTCVTYRLLYCLQERLFARKVIFSYSNGERYLFPCLVYECAWLPCPNSLVSFQEKTWSQGNLDQPRSKMADQDTLEPLCSLSIGFVDPQRFSKVHCPRTGNPLALVLLHCTWHRPDIPCLLSAVVSAATSHLVSAAWFSLIGQGDRAAFIWIQPC